jgi:hypothetical protein
MAVIGTGASDKGEDENLPTWARGRRQPRDPATGYFWPRPCDIYGQGHRPHPRPITLSHGGPYRKGRIVDVEGRVFTVEFDDAIRRFQNHEVERLLQIVGKSGRVRLGVDYPSILRNSGNYCFSVLDAESQWTECNISAGTR